MNADKICNTWLSSLLRSRAASSNWLTSIVIIGRARGSAYLLLRKPLLCEMKQTKKIIKNLWLCAGSDWIYRDSIVLRQWRTWRRRRRWRRSAGRRGWGGGRGRCRGWAAGWARPGSRRWATAAAEGPSTGTPATWDSEYVLVELLTGHYRRLL